MFAIYSLSPAPWGDDYRLVEGFDDKDDALKVLSVLEEVNIYNNLYRIILWPRNIPTSAPVDETDG